MRRTITRWPLLHEEHLEHHSLMENTFGQRWWPPFPEFGTSKDHRRLPADNWADDGSCTSKNLYTYEFAYSNSTKHAWNRRSLQPNLLIKRKTERPTYYLNHWLNFCHYPVTQQTQRAHKLGSAANTQTIRACVDRQALRAVKAKYKIGAPPNKLEQLNCIITACATCR